MTVRAVPGGRLRAAWHTWRLIREPAALLRELADEHGDTFVLELLDAPSVVTGDPALLREIFAAEADALDAPNDIVRPLVGDGSVVLADGAAHRRKRRLLLPPFHGARMRAYGGIVREAALRSVGGVGAGAELPLMEATQRLSLEVILRAVFGLRDPARRERFRRVVTESVDGFPAWLMFLPALQRPMMGRGPWDEHQRRLGALVAALREEIARARADPDGREDVLALLLAARDEDGRPMPDGELVDELRTLVIAGHETTATTLAWALWELHRHPSALARLRGELRALGDSPPPDEVAKLPFLTAVCDETLRLYPIVPILRRRVLRPWRLGPHELTPGTLLSPAVMITHSDPRLYPEPRAFRPERFLARRYGPSEFLPYGGGARRCVGAAFASYELAVALGALVASHRFAPVESDSPRAVMNGVTTRPHRPLVLRYEGAA